MYIPASTVICVLLKLVCAMDFGNHFASVHVQHFAVDALLNTIMAVLRRLNVLVVACPSW